MTVANGCHVDSRLKITQVIRKDLGNVTEWRGSFNPKELTSFSDALIQFSDKLFTELGYRIDLTQVEILHDESYRANGFVYRERG